MQRSLIVCFAMLYVAAAAAERSAVEPKVPASWLTRWATPPMEDRPLQIVHGIAPARASADGMRFYQDRGLGGIVCNVSFDRYMQSQQHWKTLIAGVRACEQLGMVVWLYDEEGYPSGAAGGLVLQENRAFEATSLVLDRSREPPLYLRPAYEHTHATNNFYMARRYPNLLDDRATRCFIDKTHEAYWKRLEPYFGRTIRAIFTDEPSLIAINLGQLPEDVRRKVMTHCALTESNHQTTLSSDDQMRPLMPRSRVSCGNCLIRLMTNGLMRREGYVRSDHGRPMR